MWHCCPVPHWICPAHEPVSMHEMSQFVPFEQSIAPWQLCSPHVTEQGIPFGQTTLDVQLPDAVQSNTHPVRGSHDVPPFARQVMQAMTPAPPAPPALPSPRPPMPAPPVPEPK